MLMGLLLLFMAACGTDTDPAEHHPEERPALAPSDPLFVDHDRNVYIPALEDLVRSLEVAFVYNEDSVQVRYRYPSDRPSWYHQYLVYEDGEWIRYGGGQPGPDRHGLYEDRISMLLDDGSVEGFAEIGGFVTVFPGMRTFTDEVASVDVEAHPYLGEKLGRSDVRKFIHETREGEIDEEAWAQTRSSEELEQLREDGVFLDMWQWRAHRSHPLGYADNGYVLEYRHGSSGTGMFTDNRDDDGAPRYMLDPAVTGRHALTLDSLLDRQYGQHDPYFIHEDNAVPFDPDRDWQDGDAIPQRLLQQPDGSRGALTAAGAWANGQWDISITRTREAPDPLDSKPIRDDDKYHAAFAVHADGTGARWHYVSVPHSIGFGDLDDREADITAHRADGPVSEVADVELEWTDIPLFYPGQVDLSWLFSPDHPGHPFVQDGSTHMLTIHELEMLTEFIVRHELELLGEAPEAYGIDSTRGY